MLDEIMLRRNMPPRQTAFQNVNYSRWRPSSGGPECPGFHEPLKRQAVGVGRSQQQSASNLQQSTNSRRFPGEAKSALTRRLSNSANDSTNKWVLFCH